jgi:hypothetical protein
MKNGNGIEFYTDGSKFIGEWKDDLKEGIGLYYDFKDNKFEEEWKYGERIVK